MADNNKYDYAYDYPEMEDPFVSVETCRQTDKPEPQILQSLIFKENGNIKDLTADDFISFLENNKGAIGKDILRFAETQLVPKLQKSKDITSLSTLLSIDEIKFQNCVLRSLQKLLMEIDLNEYSVEVIQLCLKNIAQFLQNSQEEDSLQMIVMTVPTVLRSCAIAVMLHCCYRKVKKAMFNNINKSCETIEKVWKTAISRKGIKKEEPLDYQMVQGGLALAATMGKFKYGPHLRDIFQSLDDSFTSSGHDLSLEKIGSNGTVADQYVVTLGILTKMTSNPPQMCKRFISFLHSILHQKNIEKRRTDPEFKQLGHLVISGIAFIARKFSQIETENFHIIDFFARGQQLPEEMSDFLLSVNATVAQPFISSLNLSEGTMIELAESYIARAIPGLVVHNQDRENLPKLSDHSHWMVSGGRLFKNPVRMAIKVPGISGIQIQNCKNVIESNRLVNEFDVLRTIHGGKTANIVKLWAFNPNPSPLSFYVIERFQTFLVDKLLHARKYNEFLSEDWMIERLLDVGGAINFLHQKKIIHRDITINSFAIREYPSPGHERAVLCSLQLACSNDDEVSAKTGHIADFHGENIPTRWSAPESLWEDKYDVYTDIWMIGHVIHSLFTYGCEPYTELYSETTDDIMAKVVSCGLKPYKWPCVPLPYHKLAADCLCFDRGKRTSIDIICQRLKEIRKKQESVEKSLSLADCEHGLPKISDQQTGRQHKPERGIPPVVKEMKMTGRDKRKSYFEIKTRVPTSPNPDYAPLVMTLGKEDLLSPDEPKIRIKRFELEVEEEVTVDFHDKILPKMSPDFGEKMCIRWPPVKQPFYTTQEGKVILKYSFPAAKNIMDCVSIYVNNAQEEENHHLRIVHQVACLVKRMHEKRWLLVDLTGKSIYIIREKKDFKACQLRIGRMLRLPSGADSIKCDRKLEDIMHWLPKEVIGHGEISTGSDVYTMAMLFYEFYMAVSGNDQLQSVPFSYKHRSQILSHLNDGHFPNRPPACPEWLYEEVMKPCWDQDRTSRPSAADIESIIARKYSKAAEIPRPKTTRNTAIYERKTDTEVETYDNFEINFEAYQDAISDKRASGGESDEDYVYVEKHQPTDSCSGIPSSEKNGYYNDERISEEIILDTNASNGAQSSARKESLKLKQKTVIQRTLERNYFEHADTHDDQSFGKIDVPNYELFSESGEFDAGTDTYSEIPDYDNRAIHSLSLDQQPFRSIRTTNMVLPLPHVHKENPIFQTDSSVHPCEKDNPSIR
ncbi:uncharacterized protein LOC134233858 [Saccostrea cucullata]|uniref:uncharacterized protein LOC134233858 n=1 Tax=Saccostrea cuccullata TaxID=36930 RepID=UPI002ED27D3B